MLTPSYSEIMDVINRDSDTEHKAVTSRYSVVIAASKRARQIVAGSPFDATGVRTDKAVSIAIGEISRGLVQVYPDGYDEPEPIYGYGSYGGEQESEAVYKAYYGHGDDGEKPEEPADFESDDFEEPEDEWDAHEDVV